MRKSNEKISLKKRENPTEFSSLSIENSTIVGWRKEANGKKSAVIALLSFHRTESRLRHA